MFEWSKRYETGIAVIDKQHKALVQHVKELYDAMAAGQAAQKLREHLEFVVRYTVEHFQTEEKLMREASFTGYAAHKAEHDALTARAAALIEEVKSGKASLAGVAVGQFLSNWVKHHILESDLAYVSALKEHEQRRGARP